MEKKSTKTLTREKILGMQVIDSDGHIVGTVKELSLVVGEPDQALVIEDEGGNETEARWSSVAAAGDVILLKAEGRKVGNESSSAHRCVSCGMEVEPGAMFCTNCGSKI